MTRRSVRSPDPAMDEAFSSLPREAQEHLRRLRIRVLLAPATLKYTGREIDPPNEEEADALRQLDRSLRRRESEE